MTRTWPILNTLFVKLFAFFKASTSGSSVIPTITGNVGGQDLLPRNNGYTGEFIE